jgi:hypothetical protein
MNPEQYERVDVTLPSALLAQFRERCNAQGMKLSSRIAVLVRKDLEVNHE